MKQLKRYCLLLDLKDDAKLIQEYEAYHVAIWPEIRQSIKDAGIVSMEIYRVGNRLSMIMEVDETFSFEAKTKQIKATQKYRSGRYSCGNTNMHYQ